MLTSSYIKIKFCQFVKIYKDEAGNEMRLKRGMEKVMIMRERGRGGAKKIRNWRGWRKIGVGKK